MKSSRTALLTLIDLYFRISLVAAAGAIRDRGDYDDGVHEFRMATRRPRPSREEASHPRQDLAHLPRHLKILVGFFIALLSLLVVLGLIFCLRRRWYRLFGKRRGRWWPWWGGRGHEEYRDVESNRNSTLSSPTGEESRTTVTGNISPTDTTTATTTTITTTDARLDSEKDLAGPGEEAVRSNRNSTTTQQTFSAASQHSTISRAARVLRFARRTSSFFSPIPSSPIRSPHSQTPSPKTASFAPTLTLELPPPTISWGTYECSPPARLCDSPTATIPFSDVSEHTSASTTAGDGDGDPKPSQGKRHSVQSQNSGVSLISTAGSARVSLAQVAARPANRPRIRVIGGG